MIFDMVRIGEGRIKQLYYPLFLIEKLVVGTVQRKLYKAE